jgi:predicted signal transduction protein with EAL and GGDEF domain
MLVSTSIGIALYPADGTDSVTLIHSADAAMYRAKNAGGSRYALSVCDKIKPIEPRRSISRVRAGTDSQRFAATGSDATSLRAVNQDIAVPSRKPLGRP